MSSPVVSCYADALLCHHEKNYLLNYPMEFKPLFYKRYTVYSETEKNYPFLIRLLPKKKKWSVNYCLQKTYFYRFGHALFELSSIGKENEKHIDLN